MSVVQMAKPIPDDQTGRDLEAQMLLKKIYPEHHPLLTTYELQLVKDIEDGRAVTRIRLTELREIVKRIETEHGQT